MWLEGRETGPINPHVPYSVITASHWPLVTALQQHHSSWNSAGERDGGWAISQNRCKMGRSNPSFSHLLPYSFPSKQADHAMEKSAGGSLSQATAMGWYIVLMMIWVWVHKEKLNLLSSSNASYQTSQLITFSYYWLRSRGWKKWPRGKKLSSFPLKKWILNRKRVTNRAGEEFSSIHWSKICCHLYLPTEYQNTLV